MEVFAAATLRVPCGRPSRPSRPRPSGRPGRRLGGLLLLGLGEAIVLRRDRARGGGQLVGAGGEGLLAGGLGRRVAGGGELLGALGRQLGTHRSIQLGAGRRTGGLVASCGPRGSRPGRERSWRGCWGCRSQRRVRRGWPVRARRWWPMRCSSAGAPAGLPDWRPGR